MPMDDLPDELRERLQRLNADLLTDRLRPEYAVWLACDLLMAGVESPAVMELAGESPTRLSSAHAVPLVRQALSELGIGSIDSLQASWVIARDVARQMIAGGLLPEDGAASLWGLWWACENAEELARMLEPLEAWEETSPSDRDDEAIRAEMRRLAPAVIRAADAHLAADGIPSK